MYAVSYTHLDVYKRQRVHVRRKVVHIPVRQTALRTVAAVATEQGKDAHLSLIHI